MNKREIFNKHTDNGHNLTERAIFNAMEEYAKTVIFSNEQQSDAVEFARWISRESWYESIKYEGMWYQPTNDGTPIKYITDLELYKIFKEKL